MARQAIGNLLIGESPMKIDPANALGQAAMGATLVGLAGRTTIAPSDTDTCTVSPSSSRVLRDTWHSC